MFTESIKAWNWLKAPTNKSNLYCERASDGVSLSFKHFFTWNRNNKEERKNCLALKMSQNFVSVSVPGRMGLTISSAAGLPFTGSDTPVHFGHLFDLPIKLFIKHSSQATRKPLILPIFPHKRSSVSVTQKGIGLLKRGDQGQNIWYCSWLEQRKKAEEKKHIPSLFDCAGQDNSCVTLQTL